MHGRFCHTVIQLVNSRLIELCHIKKDVIFLQERDTVKFLNFQMPENFAVIYLKFKKRGQTSGYLVKKMQMK